jgi:uncharacterized protein YuzE
MKLSIDETADALYLQLINKNILESEEIVPGIVVDYDENGEIIGVEVLHLTKRIQPIDLLDFQFHANRKKINAAHQAVLVN